MNGLTLKHLRYFVALKRFGHFGRAAEACAISQPALSMQIKELEELVDVPLIERDARQIRLTGFGEDFAMRALTILRSVDELGTWVRNSQTGFNGQLRLGIIPTIAPYLLPTIIGELKAHSDALDLHVRETLTPKLIKELSEGVIDAAIVALPVSVPSFEETVLFEEKFLLVRPSDEADKPIPKTEELPDMRLLLLEEGHCFRDQALSFCNVSSFRTGDGLDGSSLSTLVQMVGSGLGFTLIPEMARTVETRAASVSVDRFHAPEPSRTIGMIWRKSSPLKNQYLEIADIVRNAAKSLWESDRTQL